jgi:hypothetical protein
MTEKLWTYLFVLSGRAHLLVVKLVDGDASHLLTVNWDCANGSEIVSDLCLGCGARSIQILNFG